VFDKLLVANRGEIAVRAFRAAYELGAHRVIAIDRWQVRLLMAETQGKAETIDYVEMPDVVEELKQRTGGRGPDACIDAVGMEGHSTGMSYAYDKLKTNLMMETDRPVALRQAILACRSGGTVSVAGVYGGFIDKFPMGAIVNRSLTIKSGQTHVHKYMRPLLDRIERGEIDPSFIITHRMNLNDAANGYEMFAKKQDDCLKIVMKP